MADGGGWSTIESDEGVFTSLIENLGVKDVQFEELISLDADIIRSLSPVYGVIFLFKWLRETTTTTQPTSTSTPPSGTYDLNPPQTLFFANQTIQNACGTQAILSVILNNDSTSPTPPNPPIPLGPALTTFKDFTTGFPPDLLGEALSNSEPIRTAHNAFARSSPFADETIRQNQDDEGGDVYHFIAYTPVAGKLYELDGLQPHPISHGECGREEFPEKVIEVLRERIARYPEGETRFNLMAVVRDLRVGAREIGDGEALEREERKRRAWAWENTLRRSNFVGFIGEVLKGVVGGFEEWVERAKGETRKNLLRRGGNTDVC
ncbi:putative 26S proteasome-associated ubiquitin C-terminal hydrolase [Aspergillus sclerotioniger CBS 115572]|uniref:Ubiquitin carboxyl-terminal hydrolase n=1 Tax=Aspergillus sclerotioniger CBS 115572 TaxID=1450535 RepID=A0A317XEK1_9EURO|nr:putative 26S proteasome-associated ubiquitin C-terminal hydrolase [Aspergillus sclerotioniger CBS 115572]PWY95378.1 putative 26S proteasome-associated ubiquitin C-terminal hydrolase [Aspergillus sclerotioniger CBS 115572]